MKYLLSLNLVVLSFPMLWLAGTKMPEEKLNSTITKDVKMINTSYDAKAKGLILTGNNHPAHDWQKTTPVINQAIEKDGHFKMDVITNPEELAEVDLGNYRFLVINYCNWKDPSGLSDKSKNALVNFLQRGGGLLLIHFANGAWHYSLPEAAASDWPEYRNICRRSWDHSSNSAHDKYGPFEVLVKNKKHSLTRGMNNFNTTDELYYNQKGAEPVDPLLTAISMDTGREEPLAWVYTYGEGRIFQTLLGHDVASLSIPEVQEIIHRAAIWVSRVKP